MSGVPAPEELRDDEAWLDGFRRGDHRVLEQCYRRYYGVVEAAVGNLLEVADRETVVHEVFFRLLTEPQMRQSFSGPSLGAWLSAVARNRAIDVSRRAQRESLVAQPIEKAAPAAQGFDEDAVLRMLLDRFRREKVPPAWAPVFEARFLREMSQREAARHLGITRTTLAYRELRLRRMLRRFMLSEGAP